jgi:hypothetical protein
MVGSKYARAGPNQERGPGPWSVRLHQNLSSLAAGPDFPRIHTVLLRAVWNVDIPTKDL